MAGAKSIVLMRLFDKVMPVSSMESKGIDEAWTTMENYKNTMTVAFCVV
jgi:hypothetical protein